MTAQAVLALAVVGCLWLASAARADDPSAAARSELVALLNSVPPVPAASYGTLDDRGAQVGTIKIIQGPPGSGYIGVYHHAVGGEFFVNVATSTDLTHWTYVATLASEASQPTIASLPDGGYLVGLEKYVPSVLGVSAASSHLEFQFYASYPSLLSGSPAQTFDAPHTVSSGYEGTPSIDAVAVGPPAPAPLGLAPGAPMSNSTIDVGFHYYDTSTGVDRNATGVLTDFSTWTSQANAELNAAFGSSVGGNIGGRDHVMFAGYPFTVIEAQTTKGDYGSWRVYLYDDTAKTLTALAPRTAGRSVSFGNPKVTVLSDPGGRPVLAVSLFVFSGGNAPGEAGPLIYYNAIPHAALPAASATPDPGWVTNGPVDAIARVGDSVYLGGSFTEIGPRTGDFAMLDPGTGTARGGVPLVYGGRGLVSSVVSDGSGGWYIGGSFTHVGNAAVSNVAHLLAGGTLDPSWHAGADATVRALLLAGGVLYLGGDFGTVDGARRSNLAAVDPATGSLEAWDPQADDSVNALAAGPDGSTIYVGGRFGTIGGQRRSKLAAVDLTGAATAWDPGAINGGVDAIAVGGTAVAPIVYAGGEFAGVASVGTADCDHIAEFDGSGVTSWAAGTDGPVAALALSGSTLYVGGAFATATGPPANATPRSDGAAFDASTGALLSWNPTLDGPVTAIAAGSSAMYLGGSFTAAGTVLRSRLAAVDPQLGTPAGWNPDANGPVAAIALGASGVAAGGAFTGIGGEARTNLAAVSAADGIPTGWSPSIDGRVNALAASDEVVERNDDSALVRNVHVGERIGKPIEAHAHVASEAETVAQLAMHVSLVGPRRHVKAGGQEAPALHLSDVPFEASA